MRYVQAAMQRGNITAAAEALHVAPSAVAAALDQAEAVFGFTLVTRARAKGIAPTASGQEVLRRIEDLLDRNDALLAGIADLQSGFSGTLTIGYYAPIAPAFLPAAVAPLLKAHPELTLTLVECDNTAAQQGLLEGQFDLILFVADLPSAQIATRQLVHAPAYCLCPVGHAFADAGEVTLARIAAEPIVLLDRPVARRHYLDLLEAGRIPYRIVASANSTEMVRSLVAAGLGVALLNMRPRIAVTYSGDVVACVPIAAGAAGISLSLGFPPGPRRRVVQAFIDACADWFSSADGQAVTVGAAG
jgi:DNA-binding transcriptional LysR family regulator